MTDPKHAWPPPHAAHRRRGGVHRAVVVRHPRRIGSVAAGLLGVATVVTMAATFTPSPPVGAAVPPAQAAVAPSGSVPVFELPAGSGGVVVWPVRQVVDTDPITDTASAEAPETTVVEPAAPTATSTSEATPEATTEAEATTRPPAPSTTATRTRHPRPTAVATCSPGGAT